MSTAKQLLNSIALSICLAAPMVPIQPAQASTHLYNKAVKLYKTGKDKRAAVYLRHIIKQDPDHWKSHYLLANIHLRAQNLRLARKYYHSCAVNYPDVATCKKIAQAIATIDRLEAAGYRDQKEERLQLARASKKSETTNEEQKKELDPATKAKINLAKKIEEQENERHKTAVKIAKAKREQIIGAAKQEADSIVQRARQRVLHMHNNSNWLVRNTQTGEVRTGLPTFVADQVMESAYREADRIRKTAEVRARGIRIPKATHKTAALSNQLLAAPGRSGTQLHHAGTNLYVRNYTHTKSKPAENKNQKDKRRIASSADKLVN